MKIQTFKDGYSIDYKDQEFLYRGREDSTLKMIAEKVEELLRIERDKEIDKFLRGEI